MTIPLLDLVSQYDGIRSEIDDAIMNVLKSGVFIMGPNVKALEQEIALYLEVKYAIGVASGTDALLIALRSAGVGEGDDVIVPAFSFFATVGTVLTLGAVPVFVDIDPQTYLIDVNQIELVITSKTKAIIPVHLYGQSVDMDELLEVVEKYNLVVIEDNAQALGADYKGKKTGSIGHAGCLSFFPSKNLGGYGDGGMITTNDDKIFEVACMLRTHGWKKKYFPEILGYNSRLDEIQAAILRVKLQYLDEWNNRRIDIARQYSKHFNHLGSSIPVEAQERTHVYHMYMMRFEMRDIVQQLLKERGIASGIYYPLPLHLTTPCLEMGGAEGQFPISEQASRELLAIPLYPDMTKAQIEKICKAVEIITQVVYQM